MTGLHNLLLQADAGLDSLVSFKRSCLIASRNRCAALRWGDATRWDILRFIAYRHRYLDIFKRKPKILSSWLWLV